MASNAFDPKEIVTVQGKSYPVVGGRLRLAHAEGLISVQTEIVERGGEPTKEATRYVIRALVHLNAGIGDDPKAAPVTRAFTGYGEADVVRDRKLQAAILELAETRAIARALRFAGFGVEFTGAEEVSHLRGQVEEDEPQATAPKPGLAQTQTGKGWTQEPTPSGTPRSPSPAPSPGSKPPTPSTATPTPKAAPPAPQPASTETHPSAGGARASPAAPPAKPQTWIVHVSGDDAAKVRDFGRIKAKPGAEKGTLVCRVQPEDLNLVREWFMRRNLVHEVVPSEAYDA